MNIQHYLEELKEAVLLHEHPYKITFQGLAGNYAILGNIPFDLGTLKVTLQVKGTSWTRRHTLKIDLLSIEQIQNISQSLAETEEVHHMMLEADLLTLADKLQQDREHKLLSEYTEDTLPTLSNSVEQEARNFLKSKTLSKRLDKKLEGLGIVGEADNRLLVFLIAISYKTHYPLHGIVQSESGAGKSHLVNTIASCVPRTELLSLTRITSKSLYHYKNKDLTNKLIVLQDFSGLDEESQYAFRELQSLGEITTSTTKKDAFGNLVSSVKKVTAHFSSLATTTKKVYTDNQSRSVMIEIDNSTRQTKHIIQHQNKVFAGVEEDKHEQNRQFLTSVIRVLETRKVVNPFAELVELPLDARMLRRLNKKFQHLILLVTWLHQYQRKQDAKGNLVVTLQDIELAIDLFFDSLMIEIDDLPPSTRTFFEKLVLYIQSVAKDTPTSHVFNQQEVRNALGYSKSHTGRYLRQLVEFDKLAIHSSKKNGYTYTLAEFENHTNKREEIKQTLLSKLPSEP